MARNRDPFVSALRTLRERAVSGVFSPGRPIIILDEAQSLGLSTTPVREALAWLGGEGLIDRAPAGGYAGLRLDAAGLAGRYRLRLHCLEVGLSSLADLTHTPATPAPVDPARLFRSLVSAAADSALTTTYDRVQATVERFASSEAALLGDVPDAIGEIVEHLAKGDRPAARAGLTAFHNRRISIAPLLTEGEQSHAGTG
ncbi:MAG: GntR family transcriptional regulator [Brevundimonas sp.]|nr:GntR family transcriptional regulator [Brevundimonas sp.]MBN9466275.1 GntR family transcriptional regulator [Brevundimonas sp.]